VDPLGSRQELIPYFFNFSLLLTQPCLQPPHQLTGVCVPCRASADVNTINTWAEPHNANGVTPNTVIDSNGSPAGNNQQRMEIRGY